jgi:hypothetical protein
LDRSPERFEMLERVWVSGVYAGDRRLDEEEEKLQKKEELFWSKKWLKRFNFPYINATKGKNKYMNLTRLI